MNIAIIVTPEELTVLSGAVMFTRRHCTNLSSTADVRLAALDQMLVAEIASASALAPPPPLRDLRELRGDSGGAPLRDAAESGRACLAALEG